MTRPTELGYSHHGLRNIEARIFGQQAAAERDFYEQQQQALASPLTREAYIQRLRSKVSEILPSEFIPDESLLRTHEVKPEMYFTPIFRNRRAFLSDHNIAHQSIVMVGSLMGIQYLKTKDPNIHIDEEAVLTASALHDTQRFTDVIESVVLLQMHGKIGKRRAVALMQKMHVPTENTTTVAHVEQMIEYHDVDKNVAGNNYTTELGIMVAADRAALGRLFNSRKRSVRASAGYLAADRMRGFKNGGIASNPELFADFTEILSALDIMVKDKIRFGDKKKQFEYVIESAKELGIVKSASSIAQSAA